MKKWDYIIFVFIALISIACFVFVQSITKEQGSTVVIEINGEVVKKLDLDTDTIYEVEDGDGYNIIEIKNGKVSVTESNCKDQICVNMPAISKVGQSIICLPHKLVVRIEGDEQKIDGVSG